MMGLFRLCWGLGQARMGFCVSILPVWGGMGGCRPVSKVDIWVDGAGSERHYELLNSKALSAAFVLYPPGEE